MKAKKTEQLIEKINKLKEEFHNLSSEVIAIRHVNFSRSNEISIAYKQILKERGIEDLLNLLEK